MLTIRLPALDEIVARWGEIEPILKRATDRSGGRYAPIDVLAEAFSGRVGIWLIEDGGKLMGQAVAGIEQYPRKRDWLIKFVSGRRLAEWWPLFVAEMDAAARRAGCSTVFAVGRPGWVRFWKARGVAQRVASEIMIRDLAPLE